ncbi:MAG: glycosyltransferase family 4 protein [Acidobacteria bacterium]|nr:glycosyltransferase family 4 protein [Acidobacteriota bacterium]
MRPLKVAIATVGRFHVLDLARELDRLGHDVSFWCAMTTRQTRRYGLPARAHRGLLPWLLPMLAAQRYGGARLAAASSRSLLEATDRLIARRLEPCDVFIGMSGLAVQSARKARAAYGAKVFIERGSRHILSQKAILDDLLRRGFAARTVPESDVARECAGYALADRVVVPSAHAKQSFVDEGFPAERLFCNPYGVDVAMFGPTPAPQDRPPTILFVGLWSYQKGVDLLLAAWRKLDGVHLRHVGAVGDAPLPLEPGFTHVDAVPQDSLPAQYAQAHVFVSASRQEGLSLVQAQALACGVPVVCTDRTGGADLRDLLDLPEWVTVVPSDDADVLAAAIRAMLNSAMNLTGPRRLLGPRRDQLSWAAYGDRYARELDRVVGGEA